MLGQEPNKAVKPTEVKQRHPFTVSNEATVTPGRMTRPQEVVISPAVKQLNRDGYAVYNTPEKQDVYITIQPEQIFFDDEPPPMVKMAGGSFVGNRRSEPVSVQVKCEPEEKPVMYEQPADIFTNARRKVCYEEIDFCEVIIKKNDSFEKEISEAPLYYTPLSCKEAVAPFAGPLMMKEEAKVMVGTSVDAAEVAMPKDHIQMGYNEEPEYVEEAVAEEKLVTQAPAGLYVERYEPINVAKADDKRMDATSAVMDKVTKAETAATSKAIPMIEVPMPSTPEVQKVEETTVPIITEMPQEAVSETVTDAVIEMADETEGVMKLTIPSLCMYDDLIREMSYERKIPDDGLEAYDCIFRKAPVKV